MRVCVKCGSNEIIRNCNTNKVSCSDCGSNEVYKECYECGEPIKDQEFDGEKGWHHNNVGRFHYGKKPVSCFEYMRLNDEFDEEYA